MSSLPVIDWSNDFPPSPGPGQIHVWRFFLDSRTPDPALLSDEEQQRLADLDGPCRLFRCHTIMNCVDACPKHLNPTRAIDHIRTLMLKKSI